MGEPTTKRLGLTTALFGRPSAGPDGTTNTSAPGGELPGGEDVAPCPLATISTFIAAWYIQLCQGYINVVEIQAVFFQTTASRGLRLVRDVACRDQAT